MDQLIANIIITLSWVSLVALGFSLIYRVGGFFHIAHGMIMYMGASLAALASEKLCAPVPVAIGIGVISAACIGSLAELLVYRPLRNKNSHPLIMLLASIGLMIFFQSVAGILWGVDPIPFSSFAGTSIVTIFGARITSIQIYIIVAAFITTVILFFFFYKTKLGNSMRAVASNRWLARAAGIPIDSIIFYALVLSSGLAGLAGSLLALDVAASTDMAMNALLLGVVAAIIGGSGNPIKIVFGALIVSSLRHLTMWYGSSLWSDALMFGVLLSFLLIKGRELVWNSSLR